MFSTSYVLNFIQKNNCGIMFHHFHAEGSKPSFKGSISQKDLEKIINKIRIENIIGPREFIENIEKNKIENKCCITFDDGLKSNYSVAAEILDEFGMKGFFFLPVKFIELADDGGQAEAFFFKHLHGNNYRSFMREDKLPMSWSDARDLKTRGHSVGCHGYYHHELSEEATEQVLLQEIVQSKDIMEQQLGGRVFSFCWPFGSPASYSRPAYEIIRKHYRLGFTTLASPLHYKGNYYAIDRANVETDMRLSRVKFSVLGGAELYFRSRRRDLERLIES